MDAAAVTPTWTLLHTSPSCRGAEHMAYVELRRIELHSDTAAFERAVVISLEKTANSLAFFENICGEAPLYTC